MHSFSFTAYNLTNKWLIISILCGKDRHLIGFSSWSNPIYTELTDQEVAHEVNTTSELLESIFHRPPLYFRFPDNLYTDSNLNYVTRKGYLTVQWSFDVVDKDISIWSQAHPEENLFVQWQKSLPPIPGTRRFIVTAHDNLKLTLDKLTSIVQLARIRGYTFLRLDDCLERDANSLKTLRKNAGTGNGAKVMEQGKVSNAFRVASGGIWRWVGWFLLFRLSQ
jgi:hypothetical protein